MKGLVYFICFFPFVATGKIFPWKKLGYEPKHYEKHISEKDSMTAVEFSMEDPYGKEVALLDLKSGIFNTR